MIEAYRGKAPSIASPAFVADSAVVIGDVTIGRRCSIWPGAVLRGDLNSITIGDWSSIQDNSVVHVTGVRGVKIGNGVTVGHGAMLHACSIAEGALIGIAATVLDGAEVGEYSIVGAGAVVAPNTKIPPRSMVLGVPGRVVRTLNSDEIAMLEDHAAQYWELAEGYL